MLDLDHPNTENIFKASGYIDRIKIGCQKFSLQNYSDRSETFLNMLLECVQFNMFAEKHFKHSIKQIIVCLGSIESEIERLAAIERDDIEEGNCNICSNKLSSLHLGINNAEMEFNCDPCSKEIYKQLFDLEYLTGAIAI